MSTKEEFSCGIIPFHKDGGEVKVFLIHQISRYGDSYWTFPKGHKEKGETDIETAERETYEETCLRPSLHDPEKKYEVSYPVTAAGESFKKHVTYFAGFVSDTTHTLRKKEVDDAGWFTLDEAMQRLTYDDSKFVLKEIRKDLDI